MPEALNYAVEYGRSLEQDYPYVLNFGALYATSNNDRFRWVNAKTIEIPSISTTGRVDANRDTIEMAKRNYSNAWDTKTLVNQRKWSTLVHPKDIDQTNMVTSIRNITKVFNEEQKFPEMDAYCISKIYSDWSDAGYTADSDTITEENVIPTFDKLMQRMTEKRVPPNGRILYVTPAVDTLIKNAKQIQQTRDIKSSGTALNFMVSSIDNVQIVVVPPELMKTAYDFTVGWKVGASAKQIHMFLVHPGAVITPVSYEMSRLDPPSAISEGKYIYYEESFEDVFILNKKADAIQFVAEAGL